MVWYLSVLVPILFIIAGFLVLRSRGFTGRKWFFISLLAILYVMMSAYGAEWVVGAYYPQVSSGTYYSSTYSKDQQFAYGLVLLSFYNNFFNNTNNLRIIYSVNIWNITKTPGTNIVGGPFPGGNFWANPDGTSFSQICADGDIDGICDSPYILDSSNIDYLPLAPAQPVRPPLPPEVAEYDTNSDSIIERSEAVAAVMAFFNGNTSRATAVAVVVAYFSR